MNILKELSHRKIYIILIAIFILYTFFRFYNLDKRLVFDWDQEQFSTQIKQIITEQRFTLLGPRANNDKGFFLAPYLTYILVPWYFVSNLHPKVLMPFLITFNALFFFFSFFVIKKIFTAWHALFFLLFWAINPLLQQYDITPWWPLFIPLGVISVWHILRKIYNKKNDGKNWLILGMILGFFSNMHFQFVFMIVYTVIFLFLYLKKKFDLKKILISATGFFIMLIPLILFDIRHDFLNTKLFVQFFTSGSGGESRDINVWLEVFTNLIQPYIYIKSTQLAAFFYFLILLFNLLLLRKKNGFISSIYLTSVILWLLFPFFFALYGKRPSEYYFLFLYPGMIIIFVDFFITFNKKIPLLLISVLLLLINLPVIKVNLNKTYSNLYDKELIVQEVKKRLDKKVFNISFDGPPNTDTGFRYLLDLYKVKQSGNWNDPLVQIRQPARDNDVKIGNFGIFIPKELVNK